MEHERPDNLPRGVRHNKITGVIWIPPRKSDGYKKAARLLDADERLRRTGKWTWMLISQLESSDDTPPPLPVRQPEHRVPSLERHLGVRKETTAYTLDTGKVQPSSRPDR